MIQNKKHFLSLFFVAVLVALVASQGFVSASGSGTLLLIDRTGNFDTLDGSGVTASGDKVGSFVVFWDTSNPSGFKLNDHTGFNLHFNVTEFNTVFVDSASSWDGAWLATAKDLSVNLTLTDIFGGHAVTSTFTLQSTSWKWSGTDKKLSWGQVSPSISFPNWLDFGVFRDGNNVQFYLQYVDKGVYFADNGTYAPIRLSQTVEMNETSFFTNGLIVSVEVIHSGCGDFAFTMQGSDITSLPAGWDIGKTISAVVKQGKDILSTLLSWAGVLWNMGALFISLAGILLTNAPLLMFFFALSTGLACASEMSIKPLMKLAEMVWGIATGVVGAITGIVSAVNDAIHWW